ncbi:hypothetical protein GCM10011519_09210 [Marmoricola endophyticus]|uniref:lysozyme n=1 Tax=Marmoricola endophyticus TaxID=2040280 RepID=A0A917BG87_9ACTN|nr:lysozyme [Marmoricola endophyticus]GGF37816.1 hypothetical protein GCM10011519_09210 [Marmoricola endophyticus]
MSHRKRTTLALGAALSATVALAAPALAAGGGASADDTGSTPNGSARAAGVTRAGGGFMGWSAPTSADTSASGKAADAAQARKQAVSATVAGIDVASYQGNVNWSTYYSQGKRFAYVKATEGTSYTSPYFTQQYNGSYNVGMVRGAYHFAVPSSSAGSTQARYFVQHGGGWSKDGKTLPGALDIEYNPYSGGTCYGLSQASMRSWISSFLSTYKSLTGRDAVIYSTTDWWTTCTGNTSAFSTTNPLWIARYSSSAGTLPSGWGYYTFWQYSSSPLDQDRFNGAATQLTKLANG